MKIQTLINKSQITENYDTYSSIAKIIIYKNHSGPTGLTFPVTASTILADYLICSSIFMVVKEFLTHGKIGILK